MNYLYSFLMKIVVTLVLLVSTFNLWKSTNPDLLHWIMPFVTLVWLVATLIEGVKISKKNKWLEEKEEMDERTKQHSYKAGFLTFEINIGVLFVLFFAYSILGPNFVNPMDMLAILGLLNTAVYYGTKLYLVYFD